MFIFRINFDNCNAELPLKSFEHVIPPTGMNHLITEFITYGDNEEHKPLLEILGKFYNFQETYCVSKNMYANITLLTDEKQYSFTDCWPVNISFGDLDYSSSSIVNISIEWRYKNYTSVKTWDFKDVVVQAEIKPAS